MISYEDHSVFRESHTRPSTVLCLLLTGCAEDADPTRMGTDSMVGTDIGHTSQDGACTPDEGALLMDTGSEVDAGDMAPQVPLDQCRIPRCCPAAIRH